MLNYGIESDGKDGNLKLGVMFWSGFNEVNEIVFFVNFFWFWVFKILRMGY